MAGPRPNRARRAARRAERREAAAEPARARAVPVEALRIAEWAAWSIATGVLLILGWFAFTHKASWYLAVDQLGYLLSARDLLHFRLFHAWPPADALATVLPNPTDVLAQSYLWDDARLYTRYAPGFPLILAAWMGVFGPAAAHTLNPTLFVAALGVVIALAWAVHRSAWRGTAAAALVFVCPTGATLWALTVTRDVSAHLFGLGGLALLAGRGPLSWRRALAAGVVLGYAGSIRPDAVLYLVPATVLAYARWRPERARASLVALAGVGGLGVLLGLAPSLSVYWATTGSPFTPPQAIELDDFFGPPAGMGAPQPGPAATGDARVGYPPGAWRGGTGEPVSGGGMKLTYLLATLPGNWAKIQNGYGAVLVALAIAGLVATGFAYPAFAIAAASYIVVALLFYSCWGRPYGRYLVGIYLLMPILVVDGAVGSIELVRRLAQRAADNEPLIVAAGVALFVLLLYAVAAPRADGTSLLAVTRIVGVCTLAGLGAAVAWPEQRIARVVAPALAVALVLVAAGRLSAASPRAGYQRPEVERAVATVRQTLLPHAVVMTTEDIGRPAENFEYYGGVSALYLTDLERWQLPIERATFFFLVSELEPYLLIPRALPNRDALLAALRAQYQVDLVTEIPPSRNYDVFVSSAFHAGVPLELWHIR